MNSPSSSETIESVDSILIVEEPRWKKVAWISFCVSFFLFFLALFTLNRLPQDKIKQHLEIQANQLLLSQGMELSIKSSKVQLGLGLSLLLEGIEIRKSANTTQRARIDSAEVSPSFLKLLLGQFGGSVVLKQADEKIFLSVGLKSPSANQLNGDVEIKTEGADLGKWNLTSLLAGFQLKTGKIKGSANISGDLINPSTLSGKIDFDLSKWEALPQSLYGFQMPKLLVSDGKIEVLLASGKMLFKQVRLGKSGSTDDVRLTVSGDASLLKTWAQSQIQGVLSLGLSDPVKAQLSILDAILAAGKQSDGTYRIALSGALTAPAAIPAAQ